MRRVIVVLVVLVGRPRAASSRGRLWTQARALAAPSGGSGEIEGTDGRPLLARRRPHPRAPRARGGGVKAGDLLVRLDCADPEAQLAEARGAARGGEGAGGRGGGADQGLAARAGWRPGAAEEAARAQAEALAAQRDAAERQAKRLEALPEDVAASSIDQTQASAPGLAQQAAAARAQAAASAAQARAADVAIRAAERPGGGGAGAGARRARRRWRAPGSWPASACCARPATPRSRPCRTRRASWSRPGAVLVRLVDLSEVKATFYLPNAEVGAVKPGAQATVRRRRLPGRAVRGHGAHGRARGRVHARATSRPAPTATGSSTRSRSRSTNRDGKLRAGMPVQVTLPGTGR